MIIHQSIRLAPERSAVARALSDSAAWGTAEHLLAGVFDAVQHLAWMQSEDAQKGRPAPAPLPRPGEKPRQEKVRTNAEIDEWLRKRNPHHHA